MSKEYEELWSSADGWESVEFLIRDGRIAVWAGGEMDPAYLSAADALRAAEEWPTILRRLAAMSSKKATTNTPTQTDISSTP